MTKKEWARITQNEAQQLRKAGAVKTLSYLVLLKLDAGYDNTLKTNTRRLSALFDMADRKAVAAVLKTLCAAGLISCRQNNKGTAITICESAAGPDFSGEETTPQRWGNHTTAVRKSHHSGEETTPLAPFPPYPPYPAKDIYIYKRHNNKKTVPADAEGEALFDISPFTENGNDAVKKHGKDAGTFRAPLGDNAKPRQIFAVWYVKTIWPDIYATATKNFTESWFKRFGRALSSVVQDCAGGDVELAKEVTLACAARRDKNPFFNGEPPSLEYIAGSWAQDLRVVMARRRAAAAAEQARKAAEARQRESAAEQKKLDSEYWDTLSEEEQREYLRAVAAAAKEET